MINTIKKNKTLDEDELLIKNKDGYYYPANPVYSDIKLQKSENKYMVKNINDFVVKKQYFKPIYSEYVVNNEFILHYKNYLVYKINHDLT